jgi:hypothetical protein
VRSIVTVFHRRRRYMGRHGGTSNHPKQHESRGMTVLPLERITADCVAPMEAEPSIEGRPPVTRSIKLGLMQRMRKALP